jgi:hypothetical protein
VNADVRTKGNYWTNPISEHLMVWYQMETLPNFKKLYGRIYETLEHNQTYTVQIRNNFDGKSIGTKKYLYLSEVGNFGGKSTVLPWIFLTGATQAFIAIVFFVVCYFRKLHGQNQESDEFIASLKF